MKIQKFLKRVITHTESKKTGEGGGKSLVTGALCAIAAFAAGTAWAEVNSYSEPDGKVYNFIFKGSSDAETGSKWNTLSNWYTYSEDENGSPVWTELGGTDVPGVSDTTDKGRWFNLLFDGDLLDASFTTGDAGYKEITSTGINGWNMGFGFYNGVKVSVDSIEKLQNSGHSAFWMIDSTSKFVVKGWGSNTNYGSIDILIASEDGIELKPRNHGSDVLNFILSNGGTFKLTAKATAGTYQIGAIELLAADVHTGAGKKIYSKRIGTIASGTTVQFAFANSATVTVPEGYDAMVPQTAALTIADEVGACTIRQDDEAVYLDYVDRAETVTPEFTISADTAWSALVGETAISDRAIVHVVADATLTFDQDLGDIVIYLTGDKKLTPVVASDVTVTSTLNCEAYTGALQYSSIPTYSVTAVNIDFDATAGLNVTSGEWLTKIRTENKIFTFTGSGENGATLDYGETHRTEGGVAFSSHLVFKGGTHSMQYRRENSGAKFAENATQDNPTIRVTDNATLTFAARNICGWTSGNANTDGIIRVDSGSTLNYNPTNGTAYWAQQFYLEPGSTMNFTDDGENFLINGGTAQETAQIYVPTCDANTENKTATIHCNGTGKLVINWQGTSGVGTFVGANSRLKLDTTVGGNDPIFKFYGSGEVEFTKACTPKIIVDGTNKLILSADTTLNMSQINGECSVGGSGKVISAVNPSRLTAASDWTGTVEISTSALNTGDTSTSLNLAKIGNSSSKIIIKGSSGTNIWLANADKVEAEVQLDGALSFGNGSTNAKYKFAKISGTGDFSFSWNNGSGVTCTIDELNEYTGTLSTALHTVYIGNIVKAGAQTGDKLVNRGAGSGSIDISSTTVNGSAATLVLKEDGIYLVPEWPSAWTDVENLDESFRTKLNTWLDGQEGVTMDTLGEADEAYFLLNQTIGSELVLPTLSIEMVDGKVKLTSSIGDSEVNGVIYIRHAADLADIDNPDNEYSVDLATGKTIENVSASAASGFYKIVVGYKDPTTPLPIDTTKSEEIAGEEEDPEF